MKTIRVCHVYDYVDAGDTDTWVRSIKEAKKVARQFDDPSKTVPHDIPMNKNGIIWALKNLPMR